MLTFPNLVSFWIRMKNKIKSKVPTKQNFWFLFWVSQNVHFLIKLKFHSDFDFLKILILVIIRAGWKFSIETWLCWKMPIVWTKTFHQISCRLPKHKQVFIGNQLVFCCPQLRAWEPASPGVLAGAGPLGLVGSPLHSSGADPLGRLPRAWILGAFRVHSPTVAPPSFPALVLLWAWKPWDIQLFTQLYLSYKIHF